MRTDPAKTGDPQNQDLRAKAQQGIKNDAGIPRDSGVFVSTKLLSREGPGLYRVQSEGKAILVKSPLDLKPGSEFLAKLELPKAGDKEGIPFLKLKPGQDLRGFQQIGMERSLQASIQDPASLKLLKAFRSLGLPLDQKTLSKLRSSLSEGSEGDEAALAALLHSKGFEASPEAILALHASISGDRGEGGRDRREGEGRGKGGNPEEEGPTLELPAESEEGNPLSILNHSPSREGQTGGDWVLVPFRFLSGKVEFSGCLKVLLARLSRKPERLLVDVSAGKGERWVFDLEAADRLSLVASEGAGGLGKGELEALRKSLAGLGIGLGKATRAEDPAFFGEIGLPPPVDILA